LKQPCEAALEKPMSAPTAEALATIGLFADLDDSSREIVASWFEVEPAVPGQRLTLEGNAGYAFFVLDNGSAEVSVHGDAVRELTHGDYFGEIALLGGGRQTATVTVTSPSTVWTMFGTRYRELQRQHPDIAAIIAQTAAERAKTV
jgi:CRP-like cAMP-binding protein